MNFSERSYKTLYGGFFSSCVLVHEHLGLDLLDFEAQMFIRELLMFAESGFEPTERSFVAMVECQSLS